MELPIISCFMNHSDVSSTFLNFAMMSDREKYGGDEGGRSVVEKAEGGRLLERKDIRKARGGRYS
eukprot:278524-Hanusia_phi.AAC.6